MKAVIFDLDNCLADDAWRIKLTDWSQTNPEKRYALYHSACRKDKTNPVSLGVFNRFKDTHRIFFFTARPVDVEEETRHWIDCNLTHEYNLIMRNKGDHRPSVQLKREMVASLPEYGVNHNDEVECAYDDREDIVAMYREQGIPATVLKIHDVCAYTPPAQPTPVAAPVAAPKETTAADVLQSMAETFRERNALYKNNFAMVPKLVATMFPEGVPSELVLTAQWHLFELKLVKLCRFAISGLTHKDSIHDDAVYSALIESILINNAKDTTT